MPTYSSHSYEELKDSLLYSLMPIGYGGYIWQVHKGPYTQQPKIQIFLKKKIVVKICNV